MYNRYWLLLILIFVASTTSVFAQVRVDSIRITQERIPYNGSVSGVSSWLRTIVLTDVTLTNDSISNLLLFNGKTDIQAEYISFYFDSTTNDIYDFRLSLMLGHPGDIYGYSESSWGFSKATLFRSGKDYIAYMQGAELTASGFSFSFYSKERISLGVYKESSTNSGTPFDNSFVELLFYGSLPLDVPDIKTKTGFSIYPNPASGIVTIVLPEPGGNIELWDMLGRRVQIEALNRNPNELVADVSKLQPGFYWLRVGNQVKKLIVKM